MNYNSLMNKPTINYRELIGDSTVSEVGGITEEEFNTLMNTDLSSYYTKAQIDELFARSFVYREKSGSIVTFDCPSTSQNIPKVTAEIVAVQSGTGDPSPTNVRPISGWSAVNVSDSISINEEIESGSLSSEGLNVFNSTRIRTKNYISVKPNTTYLVDWDSDSITYFGLKGYTVNDYTTPSIQTSDWIAKGSTITTDANVNYIRTNFRNNSSTDIYPSEMSKLIITPISNYYTTTLKDGQGNTLTCYGGELSNVNGVQTLTVTHGYIASYNGETLPSTWISDRDVYAEGTTPTTGAEVVYLLATPQQIQQDNLAIASIAGINNIWCDSGDITVKALDRIIQG